LRLPGTYNRKQETPVLVDYEVIQEGQRYDPSDFEELICLETNPELKCHLQGAAPLDLSADFLRVLAGCPWIRHCKDEAARLPEPEWYRMLSIVGRCRGGSQIAHDLSKPHPKYGQTETEEKLSQAMGTAGPATCTFIENELGQHQFCSQCRHHGKIKSPIVLGMQKPSTPTVENALVSARRPDIETLRLPNIQSNDRQLRDTSREALTALRLFNDPPSFSRVRARSCVSPRKNSGAMSFPTYPTGFSETGEQSGRFLRT
jgi:hypothetical protein